MLFIFLTDREKMISINRKTHRGVSIAEVMIAIVVFVVGMYGILNVFMTSRNIQQDNVHQLQATTFAEGKLAELRLAGFLYLRDNHADKYPSGKFEPVPDLDDYYWKLDFSLLKDKIRQQVCKVSVTVYWGSADPNKNKISEDEYLVLTEYIAVLQEDK